MGGEKKRLTDLRKRLSNVETQEQGGLEGKGQTTDEEKKRDNLQEMGLLNVLSIQDVDAKRDQGLGKRKGGEHKVESPVEEGRAKKGKGTEGLQPAKPGF